MGLIDSLPFKKGERVDFLARQGSDLIRYTGVVHWVNSKTVVVRHDTGEASGTKSTISLDDIVR